MEMKIYQHDAGHMTKMASTSIFGYCTSHLCLRPLGAGDTRDIAGLKCRDLREAACKHQALNGKSNFLILFIFSPKVAIDK